MKATAGALAAALLAGCATLVPPPEGSFEGVDPLAAWGRVLERFVDDRGRVDFQGLRAHPADLDAVVAHVAREAPAGAPGSDERLAYWIDAYNALAMYNVLHAGVPPSSKARFFWLRELLVDGEPISLYDLENDVIRPLGEPRVHFALNCMVRSCPRLPREPFRRGALEPRLAAAAREFVDDPRHVAVDAESGVVRLSAIFDWYEEDFLAEAPSLLAWIARWRTEPLPPDARVEHLEYDWSLAAQPPRSVLIPSD